MKYWYYWFLFFIVCLALWFSVKPRKHDYIITYSYIWTNGMIGFADVYKSATSDSIGTIINEGKTQLMVNHNIPQPVLINITRIK